MCPGPGRLSRRLAQSYIGSMTPASRNHPFPASLWRLCRTGIPLALALVAAKPVQAQPPPSRIVSINVCADELLLALADPGQIASLSIYATDGNLSYLADAAAGFRHDASTAESVIGLKPDLVLAGRFTKLATREMLRRLGFRTVELDLVRSVADGIAQIRSVAALVGHPGRGEALIAAIEKARADASGDRAGPHPTIAVYQRRGYVTGGATLTGDLLTMAGFDYVGGALAGRSGGFVPLEKLLISPPDLIIVSSPAPRAEDAGSALLAHPALAELFPPERRVVIPDRLTVCGGPSLPEAIRHVGAEADRVRSVLAR
jgi:iron complex transport system substrate-binding protein